MGIIITILYTALFIYFIYKISFFNIDGISKKTLSAIFILKIFAGIFLILIYKYYYQTRSSADVFKYFDDGNIIFSAIYNNPVDYLRMVTGIDSDAPHLMKYYDSACFWIKNFNYDLYNDNRTVIRFNAIVRLFSFGYISVHTVFMCFLSFTGLTAILKVFYPIFKNKKIWLILAVYFVPSVMLWSSGILKEGILIFAFGLMLYSFTTLLYNNFKIKYLLALIGSIFLLLISKFYVLIAAIPGLVFLIWIKTTNSKYLIAKFIVVHFVFLLIAFNTQLISKYDFAQILSNKQHDFISMVDSSQHVGSKIQIPILEPNIVSVTKNTPRALLNSFFRPSIFEVHSPIVLLAAFENLIIVLLILLSFIFLDKKELKNKLLFFCISYVLILFTLTGLTTPVLGALVRYKTPALPFLFIIFLFLINGEKLRIKN
ncbi:MAG: hypothetical protein DRJ01_02675 [Bacteroidetes bacterium]|nr:MAG: hypothetical protein DRJ01_02675 [Bacteroidota bacterium]